jgi:hypothetical protein
VIKIRFFLITERFQNPNNLDFKLRAGDGEVACLPTFCCGVDVLNNPVFIRGTDDVTAGEVATAIGGSGVGVVDAKTRGRTGVGAGE